MAGNGGRAMGGDGGIGALVGLALAASPLRFPVDRGAGPLASSRKARVKLEKITPGPGVGEHGGQLPSAGRGVPNTTQSRGTPAPGRPVRTCEDLARRELLSTLHGSGPRRSSNNSQGRELWSSVADKYSHASQLTLT